jgi:polysaccharide pyruvyl transferase CsaB
MKILMLIDRLCVGGAESHVITLTRALVKQGHNVHIFAEQGAWTKTAKAAGAVCHFPPAPLTGKGFAVTALPNALYLRRMIDRGGYDILHAHTRRTAFLLRLVGRRPFCARVVTCHARFAPRYRRLCYWGEGTVAVSEDLKAHLTRVFSLPSQRICVISNGIDTGHFFAAGRVEKPHTVRLTFASRLDEDCSTAARLILSLCEKWRDVLLARGMRLSVTIVGGGEAYGALCREAAGINERAGEELVHMVGALDDPAPIFRQTDLFVGVSRAALEALFCGATVLLSGDEGMAGLLTRDNFDRLAMGNFCCRGEEALTREGLNAAFLAFLDTTKAERDAQSEQLRAMAADRLGADRMGRSTEAVYRRWLRSHLPQKWLIAGYAGCGNLGDDAIARCLIDRLVAKDPAAGVSLTVRDPADPRHRFEGATLIDRRSPTALLRAIWQSDALLLGGGCLLQNCSKHGGRSLLYYLSLAWLARLFRRPVLLVAAGIGPLKGGLSRHFVGRALRRTAYLSVRDAASRRLALSLGVSPSRIHSEADPVLSLTPAPQEAAVAFLNGHLPPEAGGRRYLCIVPRPGCMDEAVFARILRRLYEKEGIYPLFLAFDRAEDTPVCDRLIAACGVGCRIPSEDEALVAALFGLPEVVGVAAGRLHALIVAHVAGKAAVALIGNGCDGKVTGFARSVGGGILRPKMNVEDIECTLSRLWKEED